MLPLIARRLLLLVPTVVGVTFGIFWLMSIAPGDVATQLAGGSAGTEERIAEIRSELGLDDPLVVQYGRWLGDAVRLDFGDSLVSGSPVLDEIRHRLPVTLSITVGAMIVGLFLGIPLGIISGARNGGIVDRVLLFITSLGLSIPNFVLAILLINVLSIRMGWFDAVGFNRLTSADDGLQVGLWLQSILLPSLALGVGVAARLARQVRAGVVDTLQAPYVRTAWAKGCRPVRVVGKHVFKNAAIPTATVFGLLFSGLLGGTVIVESIFAMPGLGDYLVRAVIGNDLPVIQGLTVMFILVYVGVNLVVDIVYGWLNPRINVS